MTNIKARRKLSELYKKGVEVRFGPDCPEGKIGPFKTDDGEHIPVTEDEVAMWIQPPSPLQREMSLRDAQAARARALIRAKREEDSDEHLTSLAFLADMSDETLMDYVVISDQDSRRNEAMRDVLAYDEWKDITALQDALRQFEEKETPEDDPEYAAILEKDKKFGEQVAARERELTDAAREALRMYQRPDVERRALEKRSEIVGSQAFMREYEKQMTFYSVRDASDTTQTFFESADELADADDAVREKIQEALAPFIKDGSEAKNLPGAASGSNSSEPPSKPETSEASTPEEVSA